MNVMKRRKQKATKGGHRVIHRSLDDKHLGTAKTGVVTESVGDETQELVIAKFDDESREEAFDRRELLDIGPAGLSRGPVLLYPRHLWALLRRPLVMISMLLTFVGAIGLSVATSQASWSPELVLLTAVPLLLAIVIGVRLIESKIASGRQDS